MNQLHKKIIQFWFQGLQSARISKRRGRLAWYSDVNSRPRNIIHLLVYCTEILINQENLRKLVAEMCETVKLKEFLVLEEQVRFFYIFWLYDHILIAFSQSLNDPDPTIQKKKKQDPKLEMYRTDSCKFSKIVLTNATEICLPEPSFFYLQIVF